ncbi:MAG: FkbM family methyltransferase, partial [Planctomycetota bacterium]
TQQASERTIEVPTTTLDAYARAHGIDKLHLIKMDIEGAEVAALRGGADTLRRLRPIIAIEYNRSTLRRAGTSLTELDDTLDELDYDRLFCAADGSFRPVNLAECEGKSDLDAVFNVYAFPRDDPRRPALGTPTQTRKAA